MPGGSGIRPPAFDAQAFGAVSVLCADGAFGALAPDFAMVTPLVFGAALDELDPPCCSDIFLYVESVSIHKN